MTRGGASGVFGKSALLVGSVVLSLGIAEWVVRSLPDSRLGFHYDVADGRFSSPREFQVDIARNSLGFHDVEPGPVERGVVRILLLGDSYVESYSVPASENVGQRLESHLNAEGSRDYDVVSIGASAWGQREQLEALRKYGRLLRPDLVLTLFLPLNDVRNNSAKLQERVKRQRRDPELMFRPGRTRRAADTMPLFWIKSSVLNQLISHRLAWGAFRSSVDSEASIPLDYFVYAVDDDEVWREAWQETARLMLATRAEAQRLGADYAIASASTPQGVLDPEVGLEVLREAYPAMRALDWDLDRPDRILAAFGERNGIPFIALQPHFRERTAAGQTLHWRFDGHWTAEGNDVAGELLADFVRSIELWISGIGGRTQAS